jgi:peptidoglycan/LPS O-acetylase OafA/YrhL
VVARAVATETPTRPARAEDDGPAAQPDPAPGRSLGYQPAIDGLRAVALLAIVVFHAQVPGTQGAFLGVSTFFTLSGFLITTITLGDHRRSGKVPITRFYARRARRLLPASLLTIAGIVALTVTVGLASQQIRLRGDAIAALFYAENWRLILSGQSYGAIFASPSMFTHFWSLAIEEQFYLLFPLALALGLWVGRNSRAVLAAGVAAVVVASTVWSAHLVAAGTGVDRAYFGTDTRVAELGVGCLLALWWDRSRWAARVTGRDGGRRLVDRAVQVAGAAALVALLWIWHSAARTDEILYRGGLVVHAGLTALVILAALQPGGPIRRVLGWRPLVAIGVVSYGAYLVHWPIMVVLQQETGLDWPGRLVVDLALTLAVATASYRLLERPIRRGAWPAPRIAPVLGATAVLASAVGIIGVNHMRPPPAPPPDYQAAADQLADAGAPATATPGDDNALSAERLAALAHSTPEQLAAMAAQGDVEQRIAASTSPRVAFFGDSSAVMTGRGITDWSVRHLDLMAPAPSEGQLGCGLLQGKREVGGETLPSPAPCAGWLDRWIDDTVANRVDIAVVQYGPWDVRPQQLEEGGDYLVIGEDPAIDAAMRRSLDRAVTDLLDHVGVVVLVASPDIEIGRDNGRSPRRDDPDSDPDRMARYRELVEQVAERHPRVAVLDLAGWLDGRDDDNRLRPDGVHFTEDTSKEVAEWAAPEILRLYAEEGSVPAPGR